MSGEKVTGGAPLMTDYERGLLYALSRWANKIPGDLERTFAEIGEALRGTSVVLQAFVVVLEAKVPGFVEALSAELAEDEEVSNEDPAPEAGTDL